MMQTAEELAREISEMADIVRGAGGIRIPYIETLDLVPLIEADRNATRLALLAELQSSAEHKQARINSGAVVTISFGGCLALALVEARAKYGTKPAQQTNGDK